MSILIIDVPWYIIKLLTMKKYILLFVFTFSVFWVLAQSLEIYYEDVLIEYDSELTISTHPDSAAIILHDFDVTNISANKIDVNCIRENVDTVAFTVNYYCWGGLCYGETVDTSLLTTQLNSGETASDFEPHYEHNGHNGISKIKYTFYDIENDEDRFSFYINYKVSSESGVNDNKSNYNVSSAYPNPANREVSIDYKMDPSVKNAKVMVYDLLGSKVKETSILDYSGTIRLNTSDLIEGIYFYSFMVNDESVTTQRLIVKH